MAGEPPKPLLDKHDLRRECERRRDGASALKAIADYVQRLSSLFARDGAKLWSLEQAAKQQQRIEEVAAKIAALADPAAKGTATYDQFEPLLGELHKLGFFP